MKLYLDTCIWLNLFKKEKDYWRDTKKLLEDYKEIYVSTIVLKEMQFVIPKKFLAIKDEFQKDDTIHIIKTTTKDYDMARHFELQHASLSFYDYLHVAIAKRLNAILITRDRDLYNFSKNIVSTKFPKELLTQY